MIPDMDFFETNIAGVELNIDAEGSYSINFCVLKKIKDSVSILKSGFGIRNPDELLKSIEENIPIIISISGKGVIHKKINKTVSEGQESLLHKVLPNGKTEDFFIQVYEIDNQASYISVSRKSFIEQLIKEFSGEGHKLVGIALGPFFVHSLLPVIYTNEPAILDLPGHQITANNHSIQQYAGLSGPAPAKQIERQGFSISSDILVAYSAALSYFNPVIGLTNNDSLVNSELLEYKAAQKFKKASAYILLFFFAVLLINFALFSYFSDQAKSKSLSYAMVSSKLILLDSLQKQVEDRSNFLSKSGLSEPSRASFYADQIAKDLPSTVLLTAINIQPLKKKDDDHKKPEFETGRILISGNAKYAMDVNEWTKLLKGYSWIASVGLLNFKQKEGENQGEFTLELKLK